MRRRQNNRGAALLTVLVAMMLMSLMLFEFQYEAMVERRLAYNELNQLQAYYLAKSGARMGLLRVSLYGRARRSGQFQNVPGGAAAIKPMLEYIWSIPLPEFPPSKAVVGKLMKADKDAAERTLEQTRVSDGKSNHTIKSESGKINLNDLAVPAQFRQERISFSQQPKGAHEYTARVLLNYIQNLIRDSENPGEEYGDLRPEELVFNIMDWVTPGDYALAGGDKDSFYDQQTPPYKAKRGRFYTIEELRQVKGMSDSLFEKLRGKVTVYSYSGKINLNHAGREVYKALYPDFTDEDLRLIFEARDKNQGGWLSEQQFVDFVTGTLGRSNFKTMYPTPAQWPFTVSSESFLIKSMGIIEKSKSSVSRSISVGVALKGQGGAERVPQFNGNKAACEADPTRFLLPSTNECWSKPTTSSECALFVSSQWDEARKACRIQIYDSSMEVVAPAASATSREPSAMKILYWTES